GRPAASRRRRLRAPRRSGPHRRRPPAHRAGHGRGRRAVPGRAGRDGEVGRVPRRLAARGGRRGRGRRDRIHRPGRAACDPAPLGERPPATPPRVDAGGGRLPPRGGHGGPDHRRARRAADRRRDRPRRRTRLRRAPDPEGGMSDAVRTATFETRALSFRYPGAPRSAVEGVEITVPAGSLYAILGPNGSGKSTLLKLLLGALAPTSGAVLYDGRPVRDWPRRDFARRVGVVAQGEEVVFPITVRELVAMGRYPHLGPWRREGEGDRRAIEEAMARCDVLDLADRPFTTLSGGERQRARIARALAQ